MAEQLTPAQLVEVVRAERRRRWEQGDRVLAEEFLRRYPALLGQPAYALELVYHEKLLRSELGEQPALEEYLQRFPQFTTQLKALFEVDSWLGESPLGRSASVSTGPSSSATPVEREGQLPPLPCIPGYEILGRVGRGGVGIVYKARHERLNRLVALKMLLVAAHADAAQVARFRAEAEAQARVQHAHIVQIFEVGEADGWPYLALEYVDGGSLGDRLKGTPQPARWAAELVETLARAMQHAHERGLVHRDLKPANVLLAVDGTPKISDFGLAKRVRPGEASPTQSGDIVGTPSYMAPEQAAGAIHRIGPASDVYALGAILYELLTGRPPFLGPTALDTLLQVRDQEPVPPRRWLPTVPPDLETIALKCLRKEPDKRYASAEALAEDLRRFLEGEPIVARPVGVLERSMKWARRRPAAAALVVLVAALLVGGAVGGLWYAGRERDRANQESALRQQAERSETDLRAVLDFFQGHVLAAARPEGQAGGLGVNATIRDAANAAEPKIAETFPERPLVEAAIRHALGETYWYLRENQAAIQQLERALALRRTYLGPDHPDTLASMNNLAGAYKEDGQLDKALPLLEEALGKRQAQLGPDHPDTLFCMNNLAVAYHNAGQLNKAVPLLERTLTKRQEKLGLDHPDTLQSMNNLALAYKDASQLDKAVRLYEQVFTKMKEKVGPDHPDTLTSMNNLAAAYHAIGRLDKAVPLFEQTLTKRQEKLGPDHFHTLTTLSNLGGAYQALGQLDKAVPMLEQTRAKFMKKLGPDHPHTLMSTNNLANAYRDAGHVDKAMPLLEETLTKRRKTLGQDHPDTLASMNHLASAYQAVGQLDKAVLLFEQTLAKRQEKLGPDHPATLASMNNLALAYQAVGRPDKAVPLFEQALGKLKETFGPDHPDMLSCMNNLAQAYQAVGQLDKALPLFEQTLAKFNEKLGFDHPATLASMNNLALAYQAVGQLDKAVPLLEQTLLKVKVKLGPDHPHTLTTMYNLALAYLKNSDFTNAEQILRPCLTLRQQKQPDAWTTLYTQSLLGEALACQQKHADAEPLLLAAYEGMKARAKTIPPKDKARLTEALERLVRLYDTWGKPEQAAAWRQKLEQAKAPTKNPTR
jgi:tetratricopeptide (TPR) repeat protein